MTKALFKPQNSISVANYVVKTDQKKQLEITNLKMQKVLFFLQGYFLSQYQTKLIKGNFIKWKYGPVQKEVYSAFRYTDNGYYPTYKIEKPAVVIRAKKMHVVCYEPLLDKNLIPDLPQFEQLIGTLTKIPADNLIQMSRDYDNWAEDKSKVYNNKELIYQPKEIVTCFEHSQSKFKLKDDKNKTNSKNDDELEL